MAYVEAWFVGLSPGGGWGVAGSPVDFWYIMKGRIIMADLYNQVLMWALLTNEGGVYTWKHSEK